MLSCMHLVALPGATPERSPVLRLCMLRRAGELDVAVVDPGNETPMWRQPDWGGESGRGLNGGGCAQSRMGLESHRRAWQGGLGRTPRTLRTSRARSGSSATGES